MIFCANVVLDFVSKVDGMVGGYLAVILAAAVLLLLIILIAVAHAKNKKIRALKKELKSARKELSEKDEQLEQAKEVEAIAAEQESEDEAYEDQPAALAGREQYLELGPAKKKKPMPKAQPTVTLTPKGEAYASTRPDDTKEEIVVTEQASDSSKASDKDPVKYVVKYDRMKDSWIIQRSGTERVVRRLKTKEEAVSEARAMCKRQNATLVVHKKDGKFQKQ